MQSSRLGVPPAGFAFDPSMPFILGLAPSLSTKFSTSMSAPFVASTPSAFADIRDHKFLSSFSLPSTSTLYGTTPTPTEKDDGEKCLKAKIGRAVQQECRDRSRMPSSA
eukprot:TRINITY_DN41089_c0_g1_i2.p1 TRINITY_DN41089_c0_g1~~TRINITY_DN41089_c0_g1_i2.p1  ORF type:complete len:109 (-),score=15.46 TRINITY_DN41089_c0_g1_i2:23-349(-)